MVTHLLQILDGVGATASNAISYIGVTVSVATRNFILFDITKDLLLAQKALLRQCAAVTICYDNYQRGQHLKFQRGSQSSLFLKCIRV